MSARLIPLGLNPKAPPVIALQRPVVLVGRHPECDVRIDSPQVSRRHCCVAMAYDRIVVRDLGSRNGVRVNGRVIEETVLLAGDELAIGPFLYRLEISAPPPAAAIPAPAVARPGPRPFADEPDDLIPLD